ncbi:MAG: hypothetical protein Q8S84_04585 [bacterium]|nr:hypothetical protein [bacterium]MDP3380778.1 hypothetical protein [bacterium]
MLAKIIVSVKSAASCQPHHLHTINIFIFHFNCSFSSISFFTLT